MPVMNGFVYSAMRVTIVLSSTEISRSVATGYLLLSTKSISSIVFGVAGGVCATNNDYRYVLASTRRDEPAHSMVFAAYAAGAACLPQVSCVWRSVWALGFD